MKQNPVQFQKGLSLTDFLLQYGTEEKCKAALFQWRWPDGYVCPECGHTHYCELQSLTAMESEAKAVSPR
ncbi:MAG: transposase [gamma proteobacterium symbiont of Phacoides pectinatus]